MSKWKSETFDLPSKEQLKAHRQHKMNELLLDNGLEMANFPFWSSAEIALEATLWTEADTSVNHWGYETRKATLRGQLNALDANELAVYFQEIGVPESSVEDYLPESPV